MYVFCLPSKIVVTLLANLVGGGAGVSFDGGYCGHTKETASLTDNLCPIASNFVC